MAALSLRNVPDKLYELLKREAEKDRRSINYEAIWLLQKSLLGTPCEKNVWVNIDERRSKIRSNRASDSVELLRKDRGR